MGSQHPDEAPVSAAFASWGRFVLKFRWAMLALSLAGTAFFATQAALHRRVDTSVEAFLATESEAFDVLERLRDDFGRDELLLVLVEGDVFSLPYLERLKKLHEALEAIDVPIESLGERKGDRDRARAEARHLGGDHDAPVVRQNAATQLADDAGFGDFGDDEGWGEEAGGSVLDQITSLVNARQTQWRGGGLHVGGLLDDWPSESDLPALREHVLADRTLVGRVVAQNAQYSTLMLRLQFMSEEDSNRVYREVQKVAAQYAAPGFEPQVAGLPALSADLNELMLDDLGRMGAAGLLLMLLMMFVLFRHPLGVIGPVGVVAQAVIWTLGSMAFLGVPMTMLTNILPVFIIVVGIGDSVHIQSVYRDALARGTTPHEAVVHAVGTTGIPVLFTTLTTAVGLLSFRFAQVDAIQDMGTFGALGVMLALVHTLVFLPAVLSFNKKSLLGLREQKRGRTDLYDRVLRFSNELSKPRRGRRLTLLVAAAVTAISIAGATTFRVYHNPLAWIPDGQAIKDAFTTVDANLGGTADLVLLIEAKDGKTMRDRELMLALDQLEDYILAYRHPVEGNVIGNVISVLDVVRESHRATHENAPGAYRVPETQRGVADMMTLFENAGPDELRRLATIDLKKSVMMVRIKWLDAGSYGPIADYIQAGVDRFIGDKATVRSTGAVLSLLTVVDGLLTDLLRSFSLAFVVITLMMVILLRDLKLGLIAMVPNLLPVTAAMGTMAFAGIPIDLNNILLASIAIGIAVDDTIHFLHQFRAHLLQHSDVEAALEHSFAHAGRAMITTSAILVVGFTIFGAAHMYNIQRFGLLIALTVVLALLADLLFCPALLRTFYAQKASQTPQSRGGADVGSSQAAE